MIHDQGLEAKQILKEALKKFQSYYPSSKFGQQSENWHKLNTNQIMTDLSRDPLTKELDLKDFETALNRGITGEWDEKLTPSISLITFPIVKKWILRHKPPGRVNTGEKYQEPEPVDLCDVEKSTVYAWVHRSRSTPQLLTNPPKMKKWAAKEVADWIGTQEGLQKQKAILEKIN